MPAYLNHIVSAALDFVFPIACLGCGKEGAYLCPNCRTDLPTLKPPYCALCAQPQSATPCHWCRTAPLSLDGIIAPFLMEGAVREAVLQLKYRQVRGLAGVLAPLLQHRWQSAGLPGDLMAPVPLHPRRLRKRGYNQSALLAKATSRGLGIEYQESALVRTRDTMPQVGLSREQRMLNVQDSFRCGPGVAGRCVVLVDDVATTGSTLSAAAQALRTAGADSVWGLALAKEGPFHAHGRDEAQLQ